MGLLNWLADLIITENIEEGFSSQAAYMRSIGFQFSHWVEPGTDARLGEYEAVWVRGSKKVHLISSDPEQIS